ncbi:MAG: hypothetical protein ACPGE9_03860, partial [Algiphilus sp.]
MIRRHCTIATLLAGMLLTALPAAPAVAQDMASLLQEIRESGRQQQRINREREQRFIRERDQQQ